MNPKILSTALILALTLVAVVPEAPLIFVQAQTTAIESVNPSFAAGDPGSTFHVEADISGVASLLAYELSLEFNPASLNATAVDFTSTVVAGTSHFNVATTVDNRIGLVRYAVTLLGGNTVDASGTVAR